MPISGLTLGVSSLIWSARKLSPSSLDSNKKRPIFIDEEKDYFLHYCAAANCTFGAKLSAYCTPCVTAHARNNIKVLRIQDDRVHS